MSRKERRNELGQRACVVVNRIRAFERDLEREPRWWRQVMLVAAILSLRNQAQSLGRQIRRVT